MGKKIKKENNIKLQANQPQETKEKIQNVSKVKIQQETLKNQAEQKDINQVNNAKSISKAKKIKHARIIIRNLVVDINQKHIRKLLSQFGEIKQINIPKHPDKNISKGFAFVEMSNKNECLRIIKKLNGTLFKGRTIIIDLAVSKENYMTERLNQEKNKQTKQQLKDHQIKQESKGQQQQSQMANQKNQDEAQKIKAQNDDNDDDDDDASQQVSQLQQEEDSQVSQDEKMKKQQEDHQSQMFIRNLPISTTEDDLFKHFSKHGKIKFVRICKNKQTNLSKGTAFIKFHDSEVPKMLIEYSRTYEMFLIKKLRNFVPDPTIKLQIDGMIMKIFPVEGRKQIQQKLKERQGDNKTDKKIKPIKKIKKLQDLVKLDIHGKRRLSLALIGKWKAQQNMNKFDYQIFKNHEKEKIQKLKNPNESVSATRIILKHIDKAITEDQIRSLCLNFLSQKNLTKSHLTYCKLMLEKDMKKSAGFAFVEFKKHEIAKQFIQKLASSPKILQNKLFIIQFAIQDSRKMMKLNQRNKKDHSIQVNKNKLEKNPKQKKSFFKKGGKNIHKNNQARKTKFIKK